ncbi:MAG: hypothetical protein IT200_12070 [Thermoleophilia bacterium]|nr:hypothetical protein [Thermoleophilia bacterium]
MRAPLARRLWPVVPAAAGALALAPAVMAAPVVPVAECVLPSDTGLRAWFGYDNPGAAVTVPVGPSNTITPVPEDRGQPTTLLPGRQRGVFSAVIDPAVGTATWLLETDPAAAPRTATARADGARCVPNVRLEMTGPPALSGGELVTWTITLTNEGYPDIADAREPQVAIPVSAITVDVPGWSRFDLDPLDAPADDLLRNGQKLTYRWSGRFGTEICRDKVEETVEAVARVAGVRQSSTDDDTAAATSRVVACLTDLAITKTADVAGAAPGDAVTWTVTVANAGSTGVRVSDIRVEDAQVSDLVPVDPPADGWLQPGATLRYRGTMTAGACGTMDNTARVSVAPSFGVPDTNPVNDTVTAVVPVDRGACAPVTAPAPPPPSTPDPPVRGLQCPATRLAVAIATPARGRAGRRVPVAIAVRNAGANRAGAGVLRYRIPSGASLTTAPAGTVVRRGVATIRLGTLTSGATRTVRLAVALDARAGARIHRVSATAGCATGAAAVRRTAVARQAQAAVPPVTG